MSFPKDWFKFDQDTIDMAVYEYDLVFGAQEVDGEVPKQMELLRPTGELMWNDAFKMAKRLHALREAVRKAMTGERKSPIPLPTGLAAFIQKTVMIRPASPPMKGMGPVTPALLVIAGAESPYRAKNPVTSMFKNSAAYEQVQAIRVAEKLRAAGVSPADISKAVTPTEAGNHPQESAIPIEDANERWKNTFAKVWGTEQSSEEGGAEGDKREGE